MLQNSLNNLNLTASGKTYLIWTQNLYCSLSLRVKFASSSFALIRHVWLTWSSFLPWLSRIELWVDSPSITEQITNKADRVRKSPISEMAANCCDVTWLSKLISIPDWFWFSILETRTTSKTLSSFTLAVVFEGVFQPDLG